jgi:hypothetical protein
MLQACYIFVEFIGWPPICLDGVTLLYRMLSKCDSSRLLVIFQMLVVDIYIFYPLNSTCFYTGRNVLQKFRKLALDTNVPGRLQTSAVLN